MLNSSCNYTKVVFIRGIKVDTKKPWKHQITNTNTPKPSRKSLTKSGRKFKIQKGRKIMTREIRENNAKKANKVNSSNHALMHCKANIYYIVWGAIFLKKSAKNSQTTKTQKTNKTQPDLRPGKKNI